MNPTARRAAARRLAGTVLAVAGALALPGAAAHADDTPAIPRAQPNADPLGTVRARIAERRWSAALDALRSLNDTGSADWNNLAGYVYRHLAPPDLAAAGRHYDEALRIDPAHRGALEYSGELALMQGQLPRAEQRLAALEKACGGPCKELDDLREALARYKANGNKPVAR